VLVAGFARSHPFHDPALDALAEVRDGGRLITHTLAESFAVLTAPAGPYRVAGASVIVYLDQFLAGRQAAAIPAGAYSEAMALLSESGSSGGAIYDALIALAAREAGLTLVSLDRRARSTYELCGVEVSLLDGP
jgi:predicted nucleic acid-binding protein